MRAAAARAHVERGLDPRADRSHAAIRVAERGGAEPNNIREVQR